MSTEISRCKHTECTLTLFIASRGHQVWCRDHMQISLSCIGTFFSVEERESYVMLQTLLQRCIVPQYWLLSMQNVLFWGSYKFHSKMIHVSSTQVKNIQGSGEQCSSRRFHYQIPVKKKAPTNRIFLTTESTTISILFFLHSLPPPPPFPLPYIMLSFLI